jgi:cobyric acid synthase
MPFDEFQRRLPSADRKISEIQPEDMRVRVMGTVIDRKGNTVILDDGTGKIQITFAEEMPAEIDQFVRVFGRVIPVEGGFQLEGELVQNMEKLDKELLKKVEELEKKLSGQ